MSSKSRSGLSKREYAAKQAGGTLNYKTGKISTPAKKTTSKSSSKTSSNKVWVAATKGNLDASGNAPKGQFPVPDTAGYWQDSTQPNKTITAYDPGGSP